MSSHKDNEHWNSIIKPQSNLFDLGLGDLWRYRDLLVLFVQRDFVAQYKQTILGPIWNFIQPIFTTIMFLLVFGKIANIPTDGIPPVLFYMSGITIWNYFSSCITSTSTTFVTNAGIFGKVYFPRLVIPLSIALSNIIRFGIQFVLLLSVMGWDLAHGTHLYFGWNWLLIPFLVLLMAGMGLGLGVIISALTTKYRDFNILITFGVQLLMYVAPVAYPMSFLMGKNYKWVVTLNPLSPVIEAFRFSLFKSPQQHFQLTTLWYSVIFTMVSLLVGFALFNKVERTFMDTV